MKKIIFALLPTIILSSCSPSHNLKEVGSTFVFSYYEITYTIEYIDCSKSSLTFNVTEENERMAERDYHLYIKKSDYLSTIFINGVALGNGNAKYYEEIKCENNAFKMECFLTEKGLKIFDSKCDVDMSFYPGCNLIVQLDAENVIRILFNR